MPTITRRNQIALNFCLLGGTSKQSLLVGRTHGKQLGRHPAGTSDHHPALFSLYFFNNPKALGLKLSHGYIHKMTID